MRRNLCHHFRISVLLLLCLLLPAGSMAQQSTTVKIGYMPIGDCLQLYVAEELGFFKDEGLTIETTAMKGGAVIAPAVEAGEVQIGWSNAISIIIAHVKGFDFVFLTSGAMEKEPDHRVHSLLVGKDSSIKEVTDLVGKKVAINTLGNVNELSMMALADSAKIDIKQIQLVEIPFPQMEAALQNGSVDAILAIEPFVTLSLSHGTARVLVKSIHQSFGEQFMIGSWFAKKSWIEKEPAVAAAFVKAINRASDYIAQNPGKIPEILVKYAKLPADLADKITLPYFASQFHVADLQRMIDITAKYKLIAAPYPATEIISRFLQ